MNGIEILAEEIVYKFQPLNLFFWLGIIGCMPFIIWLWVYVHKNHELDIGLVAMTLVMVVLVGAICGTVTTGTSLVSNQIDYVEYQVTVDDSVSMNEFLDKYEILDQEGKIYTVKERE